MMGIAALLCLALRIPIQAWCLVSEITIILLAPTVSTCRIPVRNLETMLEASAKLVMETIPQHLLQLLPNLSNHAWHVLIKRTSHSLAVWSQALGIMMEDVQE